MCSAMHVLERFSNYLLRQEKKRARREIATPNLFTNYYYSYYNCPLT